MSGILVSVSPVGTTVLDENGQLLHIFSELGEEFYSTIKSLSDEHEIISDYQPLKEELAQRSIKVTIDPGNPILKKVRISKYEHLDEVTGQLQNYEEYRSKVKQEALNQAFAKIKSYGSEPDELIAQVVMAIDDLQKTINLMGNRLSELYALHFPELVDSLSNQVTLAKLVVEQPNRANFNIQLLHDFGIPKDKISAIESAVSHSLGGDLPETDLHVMKLYAQSILQIVDQKSLMEKWIDQRMASVAPNLTALAGANVGARLISSMGSLASLAKTHASKIQIIGAEKALYSALRGRGSPPKHGIIFQIPEIGNSPYWIRGKIARAFAAKIAIAARLDYFDGEFLGEKMREDLRTMEMQLRNQHPEPTKEGDQWY